MLPITSHLLKPIIHAVQDDNNESDLRKPMTEADVCQRIQTLLSSEKQNEGEEFDEEGMMMRGV